MHNKSNILHNIALYYIRLFWLRLVFIFYTIQVLNKNSIKMANILDSNDIFIKSTIWYLLIIFKT